MKANLVSTHMLRAAFLGLIFSSPLSWGQDGTTLPEVQMPVELQSGRYSEGVMTKITQEQIAELVPWAQDAKKRLSDALVDSARMAMVEKVAYLESVVEQVVQGSGTKKYQLLMRYALNRGLLLSAILEKESDVSDKGIIENQLDFLKRSIDQALVFYQSDLEFQKELVKSSDALEVESARFGLELAKSYLEGARSVLDASAQYQLTRKIYEMLNWDLYQDQHAKNYADEITEIYQLLKRLPETAIDEQCLKHIRDFNYLWKKSLSKLFNPSAPTKASTSTTANSSSQTKSVANAIFKAQDFAFIPAGTFMMGSPESEYGRDSDETRHRVTLTEGFEMQVTEVTQAQWLAIMGYNNSMESSPSSCYNFKEVSGVSLCPNHPVEKVSWEEIQEFIENLNASQASYIYRLPTEAEWEYAARGHSIGTFFNGDTGSLGDYAWYEANSAVNGYVVTHEVAKKKKNQFGLYDMYGNVGELVQDLYGDYPSSDVTNPINTEGSYRVYRGGSHYHDASRARSADRTLTSSEDSAFVGFRLVRTPR